MIYTPSRLGRVGSRPRQACRRRLPTSVTPPLLHLLRTSSALPSACTSQVFSCAQWDGRSGVGGVLGWVGVVVVGGEKNRPPPSDVWTTRDPHIRRSQLPSRLLVPPPFRPAQHRQIFQRRRRARGEGGGGARTAVGEIGFHGDENDGGEPVVGENGPAVAEKAWRYVGHKGRIDGLRRVDDGGEGGRVSHNLTYRAGADSRSYLLGVFAVVGYRGHDEAYNTAWMLVLLSMRV